MNISEKIAHELNVNIKQVDVTIELLDGGATVPFISRYRKEVTGGLSDVQLRNLEERLIYLRELEDRKKTILKSILEQNKLTPGVEQAIVAADNKSLLEDLYLPYKPKRRTKAQLAKEAGLEPLADELLSHPENSPEKTAEKFINLEKNIASIEQALEGARAILMESFSENALLIGDLRDYMWENGMLKSEIITGKELEGNKFLDYFAYQESIKKIPSHRALALFRGQRDNYLNINLILDDEQKKTCVNKVLTQFSIHDQKRLGDAWLIETANWTFRIKLFVKLELELLTRLREIAEEAAIEVFANNLKHLLMAAPAGSRVTLGLDPGLRTGVKVIIIDATGKLLEHTVIYPHAPRNDWDSSIEKLAALCAKYHVELIAIGNGTGSRETDKLVLDLKKRFPDLKLTSIMVSEAGASVYSASELAFQEFPDLDVSYRGAVSIGRRLQDPLAELVKIEPKSIGVGQYQHDVNQVKLSRTLYAVMEDCVNAVGVDLNTASVPLLSCVAGLSKSVAERIVLFRDQNGPFRNRQQLKKVPRLGEKSFEQAAGFLRVLNGDNPLDASAVHPEAYPIVEKILSHQNKSIKDMMGNSQLIKKLNPKDYTNDDFGIPTVTDIFRELEKPGRDPRPEFKTAVFKEGITTLKDLSVGMVLEGIVTNVANFGAFVDIGVHQDGLVHISMLADRFVKDPHEIVKVGNIVKVKILEVDLQRKRIQLSMRLTETTAASINKPEKLTNLKKSSTTSQGTALGNALIAAFTDKKT